MKTLIITISMLLITALSLSQSNVSINDFKILNNTNWKGTLSYLDYSSGNQSEVEATMQIKIEGQKIKSNMQYTYEPHKNNKSSVQIKKDGAYFGNEKIVSNTLENDTRIIITTYTGKDNGRKADFFKTHTFNNTTYSISKKVVFKDTKESIIRNTYTFNKID
jgi:hypothetical protein